MCPCTVPFQYFSILHYLYWVLGKTGDHSRCGTCIGEIKVNDLISGDDALLLAETVEVLVMAADKYSNK